jgi:hypothetical protein
MICGGVVRVDGLSWVKAVAAAAIPKQSNEAKVKMLATAAAVACLGRRKPIVDKYVSIHDDTLCMKLVVVKKECTRVKRSDDDDLPFDFSSDLTAATPLRPTLYELGFALVAFVAPCLLSLLSCRHGLSRT